MLALNKGNALCHEPSRPMVLSSMTQNGARITATNPGAEAEGLRRGMSIADARAICPHLEVEAADPQGDLQALEGLALWSQRYTPLTHADADEGVILDISGCTHLFGTESKLARDFAKRLNNFGLTTRLAIAPTIGSAWAAARHADTSLTVIEKGEITKALSGLPISGLRLDAATRSGLEKLGLKRIGMLEGKPRAALVARFGPDLVQRLDQALGHADEQFEPCRPAPFYRTQYRFADPVVDLEPIAQSVAHTARDMADLLYRRGVAARQLELILLRVDGWHDSIRLRLTRLSRDPSHMTRLLMERLERIAEQAGFGFEMVILNALEVEDCDGEQDRLTADEGRGDISQLLDRLANRFGATNVVRFAPRQSFVPERGVLSLPVTDSGQDFDWAAHLNALHGPAAFERPLLLFLHPEPITVLVEMPDKPPARFSWRRISHKVAKADGPERIAPEWWRPSGQSDRTRDYYRIEDEDGRRFWLFREGLYERAEDSPRWFVHGLFS